MYPYILNIHLQDEMNYTEDDNYSNDNKELRFIIMMEGQIGKESKEHKSDSN